MRQRKLLWRIYLYFFAATVVALAATSWYATHSFRQFHQEQVASDLLARAQLFARELAAHPPESGAVEIDRLCKQLGNQTKTRFTVILPNGVVIGDSERDPATMENHRSRPEIATALLGQTGQSFRYSDTLSRNFMYVAIPVERDGAVIAVVRSSLPLATVRMALRSVYAHIVFGGLVAAVLFALVAFHLSRRITRPLGNMRQVAERLAGGDLTARVAAPDGEETGALARALNQMAVQLSQRLRIITEQRNEQEAVFASMAEGVLAVDKDGRILHLNPSAARLLGLAAEQARGRSIQETVRNPDLQKLVAATLSGTDVAEGEIALHGDEERVLQIHGTALQASTGANIGALVVLNDITRLKRLEIVRRDFVANVSHELKTPIAALKGCVETLTDDAVANPDDARHFLAMMSRQVDRLNSIVEDLLSLSRIEFETEHGMILREPGAVCDVLRRAAEGFRKRADEKRITLTVDCADDLTALVNAPLLEEAVGNLLDNAIKYGSEGMPVTVSGMSIGNEIEIRVSDRGPGIEKKHLPRIFERFYRVDQARSRALGGTGLGLSIVKHIVLAHRGGVSVESAPGQGSIFTIRIPRQ